MRVRSLCAALLTATVSLSGCFGSSPKTEYYYRLTLPKLPLKPGKGPRLSIGDFSAEPGADSQRIAFREQKNELRYYGYRQWVAEPSKMLPAAVVRHLRASKRFSHVAIGEKVRDPLGILEGSIAAIEEIDAGDRTLARLSMTFVLRAGDGGKVLLRHTFDETLPCAKRHPREVAEGISKLLEIQMRKLARQIADKLRE